MRTDFENPAARNWYGSHSRNTYYREKSDGFWTELLEKENEAAMYKERLKELEIAFNYNLGLISERDLELNFLEKQLHAENERFQKIFTEKKELEDIIRSFDYKNHKKIQELEFKLSAKEAEIRDLQRNNRCVTLKKSFEEIKQQQQSEIYLLSSKYEKQKDELLKKWKEEMEEKEKYYLFEIDNLAGQLQEEFIKKEKMTKENQTLKNLLKSAKKLFQQKGNFNLEELKTKNNCQKINIDKAVQSYIKDEVRDEEIQVSPAVSYIDTQTIQTTYELEESYKKKADFLQEQNEVLKCVIKDLKKNRDAEKIFNNKDRFQECTECKNVKVEIEKVNRKFEQEINNLKQFVEDEKKQRAEEETVIQSLETSVSYLKDKLILGLQEKLKDSADL